MFSIFIFYLYCYGIDDYILSTYYILWDVWLYFINTKKKLKPHIDDSHVGHCIRIPKKIDVVLLTIIYAQVWFQWLATPLSKLDPLWALFQGLIKFLNSALHGIERTTSRSSANAFTTNPQWLCQFHSKCVYI